MDEEKRMVRPPVIYEADWQAIKSEVKIGETFADAVARIMARWGSKWDGKWIHFDPTKPERTE